MSLVYLNTPFGLGADWDDSSSSWPLGALTSGGQRGQTTGGGQRSESARTVPPRMDWIEQDDKCIVVFELPGHKKKDIDISLHNNLLTITGTVKPGFEINKDYVHLINERRFGVFSRSFTVPSGLKDNDIKATMESGLLRLEFPKQAKEGAAKKIAIAQTEATE